MLSRLVIAVLCVACLVACRKQTSPDARPPDTTTAPTPAVAAPKRIVLFIGDGMGVGQITAGLYAAGEPLSMLQMPHVGVMTTHEHEFLTTDSAASATAISTGRKAGYEAVSVVPGTTEADEQKPEQHMQTLLELAAANGLRTGLVSTSRVNHATGGAFGAHRFHRHQYEQIAADFVTSKIDVLIGPGAKYFTDREDGRNLLEELAHSGWATPTSAEELGAAKSSVTRVAALLSPKDFPFVTDEEARPMPLADMFSTAVEVLDRDNDSGWVLVVEGSFVDWCAHNLDGACAAMEVLDLDAAVQRARAYAQQRDDTLVVVTADHETAGMSVIDPYYSDRFSKILGGEDKAAAMVSSPDGSDEPPPFQHIEVGGRSATLHANPLPNPGLLGMTELVDGRASIVSGHFSLASRAFWRSNGRFYSAHTPVMVTIHAEGPGARNVVAARDNADLGRAIRELVAGKPAIAAARRKTRPKNIVLLIGDGMGLPSITAAHYWSKDGLRMLESDITGLVSTHAIDYLVNDSAATATAMSTGQRTRKKAVGKVMHDGQFVAAETVLEQAEKSGIATGIVTTTPITHATPAAFYAHQDTRYEIEGIVSDLISLPKRAGAPEVLLGGGAKDFDEATLKAAAAAGYTVSKSWPPADGPHVLGLYADEGLEPAKARFGNNVAPSLPQMTEYALERLDSDEDGFFLLVEGGQIDWRLHEGVRDDSLLHEVVEFDDAVGVVLNWAAKRDDTLVIVTSDHDHTLSILDNHYAFESGRCGASTRCGGPYEMLALPVDGSAVRNTAGFADTALQGEYAPPMMYLQYAWPVQIGQEMTDVRAPHSANLVPLFATGPMADELGGFIDQPEIGEILLDWARK